MTSVLDLSASSPDFASLRVAGKDALSLALIDIRNRTLRWAAAFEAAAGFDALRLSGGAAADLARGFDAPLWTLGHIAWFQERWIARNVQRARGERADPSRPLLASAVAGCDRRFDPAQVPRSGQATVADGALPDLQALRDALVTTLETTLDLLAAVPAGDVTVADDDALYFFRLALFHEALQNESFAALAQAVGVDAGIVAAPVASAARSPIVYPATRWLLGAGAPGFAFDNQRGAHPVDIPEFELDAQPVTWAQYAEFVEDGGYDEPSFWGDAGRAWLERERRRTPRYVEQMRHGVLQHRFGRLHRVPLGAAAVHVTWHEADAWCRWAGRRLPGEAEWEAAAHQGASRGFRFGSVLEWTATTFRPYPGFVPGPWASLSQPHFGKSMVLRGAASATPLALVGRRIRRFAEPDRDDGFFGFRSAAA